MTVGESEKPVRAVVLASGTAVIALNLSVDGAGYAIGWLRLLAVISNMPPFA